MMKETDFLINALTEWCKKFNGIHVRYAYDATTEYHIVEVDPESVRRGNEAYKEAEYSLWTAFMEEFPESDLLICEPSKSNNMANCLFDSSSEVAIIPGWVNIWTENLMVFDQITSLSKRSVYSRSNEYDNKNEYALAA